MRLLFSLKRDRFGNAFSDTTRHMQNLSDYDLSDTENFVLSHGLNFGLPPRYLCKEEIFVELWARLLHHSASSVEQRTALKAGLADLTFVKTRDAARGATVPWPPFGSRQNYAQNKQLPEKFLVALGFMPEINTRASNSI